MSGCLRQGVVVVPSRPVLNSSAESSVVSRISGGEFRISGGEFRISGGEFRISGGELKGFIVVGSTNCTTYIKKTCNFRTSILYKTLIVQGQVKAQESLLYLLTDY